MKRYSTLLMSAALIAGITIPNASAADDKKAKKKPAVKAEKPAKKKRSTYSFRGTVGKTDVKARTIVLKQKKGDRTIVVAKDAKIMKDGKKAELSDIKVGGYVTGSVKKNDGKETAVSVYLKPKPAPKSRKKSDSKTEKKPAKKKDS